MPRLPDRLKGLRKSSSQQYSEFSPVKALQLAQDVLTTHTGIAVYLTQHFDALFLEGMELTEQHISHLSPRPLSTWCKLLYRSIHA